MDDKAQNKLRIKFLGAIGTATGSCTLLEYSTPDKLNYYLVDIGSYQNEKQADNTQKILKDYAPKLSKIFITHAHLDHIGLLPYLVNYGFKGEVWCTKATMELMKVMLEDAIKIQIPDIQPNSIIKEINFTCIDDEAEHPEFVFKKSHIPLAPCLFVNITRSAHILGSVSFNFELVEQVETDIPIKDKEWIHIHFSGDIGPVSEAHIPNILFKHHHIPFPSSKRKYIVLESTYGGHNRDKTSYTFDKRIEKLGEIIEKAFKKGQTIIIPAFALDRAQQLLVDLYYWRKHASLEFKKFCAETIKWTQLLSGNNEGKKLENKIISEISGMEGIKKEALKKNPFVKDLPSELQDELLSGWDMKLDIEIESPLINEINNIY
ncbi:MAG: MBL fold metallo-hydrolase [Treponema sp.]|jgi:Cft2 family RNA processing exonuclease|nr:MBL fold metallo-hydrolase [Treponema sp.]